jgi:hypothetical protein
MSAPETTIMARGLAAIEQALRRDTPAAAAELDAVAAQLSDTPRTRTVIERDLLAARHRLQLATDAALAAHSQAQVARAAVVTLATRLHETHAQHHPGGTTWLTCVSETCEASRRLHGLSMQVVPEPSAPTPEDVVAMIAGSLLCRAGEVITPQLADERARNLACWVLVLLGGFRDLAEDTREVISDLVYSAPGSVSDQTGECTCIDYQEFVPFDGEDKPECAHTRAHAHLEHVCSLLAEIGGAR